MDELEIEKYLRLRGTKFPYFCRMRKIKRKFFGMRLCSCKNGERAAAGYERNITVHSAVNCNKNRRIADEVRVRV